VPLSTTQVLAVVVPILGFNSLQFHVQAFADVAESFGLI
jgi:hypothetical protein